MVPEWRAASIQSRARRSFMISGLLAWVGSGGRARPVVEALAVLRRRPERPIRRPDAHRHCNRAPRLSPRTHRCVLAGVRRTTRPAARSARPAGRCPRRASGRPRITPRGEVHQAARRLSRPRTTMKGSRPKMNVRPWGASPETASDRTSWTFFKWQHEHYADSRIMPRSRWASTICVEFRELSEEWSLRCAA